MLRYVRELVASSKDGETLANEFCENFCSSEPEIAKLYEEVVFWHPSETKCSWGTEKRRKVSPISKSII